jgi:NADPH:quinone reductase
MARVRAAQAEGVRTTGATVRAIGVVEFGGPEQLRELSVPRPEPARGEVRIRVHAAGVNPADALLRAGKGFAAPVLRARQPPYIPGMDAAGIVDELGADVDGRLSVGDRVIALVLPTGRYGGAYADEIVVPEASVVGAPPGVDLAAAGTLPLNGLTARLALDALNLSPGATVLVTGAAGAVGGFTVELAKADGLRVIAEAAPADYGIVKVLGADKTVARGEEIASAVRALVVEGVDGVVDAASQQQLVLPAIKDGGAMVSLRGWSGPSERGISVLAISSPASAGDTARLERLRDLAAAATLTLRVASILPARDGAAAHRLLEAGALRGRLVLDFSS